MSWQTVLIKRMNTHTDVTGPGPPCKPEERVGRATLLAYTCTHAIVFGLESLRASGQVGRTLFHGRNNHMKKLDGEV